MTGNEKLIKRVVALFVAALAAVAVPAWAQLDFEQEVIAVPATHETKDYAWLPRRNPSEYAFTLTSKSGTGAETPVFELMIRPPAGTTIRKLHVLVTDKSLKHFRYIHPEEGETTGTWTFPYAPPSRGTYRFETVLETDNGWVNLRKDLSLKPARRGPAPASGTDDYEIRVKTMQSRRYSDHVITFIFELSRDGEPVTDLEPVEGADFHVGAWNRSFFSGLRDFIYGWSRQNTGGPEVPVSLVFTETGRYRVFAQFRHRGKDHVVELELNVLLEPGQGRGGIVELAPADD